MTGLDAVATVATGSLGALVIAGLVVALDVTDFTTFILPSRLFLGGAAAATGFLAGLAVDLRAADLATLALLAGAFAAGARFVAVVLADFFTADFFVAFLAAATLLVFFVFFAIFVFPIAATDCPNHTNLSV
jgi:hypothetical protein